MKLTLVNFQSEEEFDLDAKNPVVIGRGSLLGCSDKKVSRNHAQIQLTPDGNVHILALHTNPCFFMKNGLPPVCQLAKDEEKTLSDGDYIGLLPDSFWYKIVVKKNDPENGLEISVNSTNVIKDQSKNVASENNVPQSNIKNVECVLNNDFEPQPETSKAAVADDEQMKLKDHCDESKPAESSNNWLTERLKALEKTKRLPLSMYEIDDFPGKMEQFSFNDSVEDDETQPDEKGDSKTVTSADASLHDVNFGNSSREIYQGGSKVDEDFKTDEKDGDNVAHCSTANVGESKTSDTGSVNMNSPQSHKRPLCQYEEKCYRKNEQHRRDYCHPGDDDYIPYAKRPKCQYGASCYRRNKTHHVEYQHPKSKKPKTNSQTDSPKRKRQKKKETEYRESSEEDDYDMEDPFIDDASSDEYVPSDLDDDDDDLTPGGDSTPTPKRGR